MCEITVRFNKKKVWKRTKHISKVNISGDTLNIKLSMSLLGYSKMKKKKKYYLIFFCYNSS